jgi:cytochrome c
MRTVGLLGVATAATVAVSGLGCGQGDAEKGKAEFAAVCAQCHQVGADAKWVVGPPLTGVVERKAANVSEFADKYSPALKKKGEEGLVWSEENIDKWIADPKAMIPDSPMAQLFKGVPEAGKRADIIAYLDTVK